MANIAYGQTNTRDDPAYWEAHLTHVNPTIRAQAQINLERIQRERSLRQQQRQFDISQTQHRAEHQSTLDARREQQQEAEAGRQERSQASRNIQQEAAVDRRIQALLVAANNEVDPAKRQQLLDTYQSLANPRLPGGGAQQAAAPATDPNEAAVRDYYAAKGKQVQPAQAGARPAPQGAAPSPQYGNNWAPAALGPSPQDMSLPWGAGAGGGDAGIYKYGTPQNNIAAAKAIGAGYVEGGVYGGPPGFDFNTNTGEWIRSGVQGLINGRPAGDVVAELAMKHGRSPESPSGMAAYANLRRGQQQAPGLASTPRMDIPFVSPEQAERSSRSPQTGEPVQATPPAQQARLGPVNTGQPSDRNYGSGAMSSGTHSGEWLADQLRDVVNVSFDPRSGRPPENVMPQMTPDQLAAIEERRRQEEEARRRAAQGQ